MQEEYYIKNKKFRNIKTGEIVEQIPSILEINDYEEVEEDE